MAGSLCSLLLLSSTSGPEASSPCAPPGLLCDRSCSFSSASLRRKLQTFTVTMVNTAVSDEEKGAQEKESKEESILAMLGIIGTILNLIVIIFVYIYTTL
ncbi:protein TUNAR [Lepisosteus oculatus]|uniref:protein TUNAR n=1 Tax=Lepisosteus oculatus TaxID=7918 RepID=UPI00371C0DA2